MTLIGITRDSVIKIAHELGRKDHTTAIHSIDKIEKELSLEGPIKQNVSELKERLYA